MDTLEVHLWRCSHQAYRQFKAGDLAKSSKKLKRKCIWGKLNLWLLKVRPSFTQIIQVHSSLLLTTNIQKTNVDLTLRKNKYGISITCVIPNLSLHSNKRSLKIRVRTNCGQASVALKLLQQIFHMQVHKVIRVPMQTGLLLSIRIKQEIYTVFKIRWALPSMIKTMTSRRKSIRRRRWILSRCGIKKSVSANSSDINIVWQWLIAVAKLVVFRFLGSTSVY